MLLALLDEARLDDAEKVARGRVESGLLLHLAHERDAPRLAELDVSAGKIGIAPVLREAEQDLSVRNANAARNRFNVFFFAHDHDYTIFQCMRML